MRQSKVESGEISGSDRDPGDEDTQQRCAARGFHEFVMGLAGCRVCGAPDVGRPAMVTLRYDARPVSESFRRLAERIELDTRSRPLPWWRRLWSWLRELTPLEWTVLAIIVGMLVGVVLQLTRGAQ
jgi:hypothetical protein